MLHAFIDWVNSKTTAFLIVVGSASVSWSLSGFLSSVASAVAILVGATHLYDWWKRRRKGK